MDWDRETFPQRALETVKQAWKLYVLENNPDSLLRLLPMLADDMVVIGTGKHEFYRSKQEFLEALARDRAEAEQAAFEFIDEWYDVQPLTEDVCLVYGTLWIREKESFGKSIYVEMDSRFTVICRNTPQGVKICNLHHSIPYMEQLDGEYYPRSMSALAREMFERNQILELRAEHDSLTELYNRAAIQRYVEDKLEQQCKGTFFMIDLDGFKAVNDTLGHLVGDEVITLFADVLRKTFGKGSLLGRMGGDEFCAFSVDITLKEAAEQKAAELLNACRTIGEKYRIPFGCSIGICSVTEKNREFQKLYRYADTALYYAKKRGGGIFQWRHPGHCMEDLKK